MINSPFKPGDPVIISGELTGYGILEGYVCTVENFFGKVMITANYYSDSIIKAEGRTGITGYGHFFALKKSKNDKNGI